MIELKVIEQINHFTNKVWFVVNEMECGTELASDPDKKNAIKEMNRIISKKPSLYFTKQKTVEVK